MSEAAKARSEGEVFASLSGVSKFYGSYAALKDVSLTLRRGEVHMLLGENGAGKSTLVSLLTGANRPDEGEVTLLGRRVEGLTPAYAREAGVNAVLQDFALAPTMTVAENYALGREETWGGLLSTRTMREQAVAAMAAIGVALDPDLRVDRLSRAEQQLLEIVRALGGKPGALILDEPTATLSHDESERLFAAVLKLRAEGWAILYISHRMEEIRRLGDVVTILRDGRLTGHHRLSEVTNEKMVAEMVGRDMGHFYPDIMPRPGNVAFETRALKAGGRLKDASLNARYGEIVGIGGLVGCGKAEVARAAFGLVPVDGGSVWLDGAEVTGVGPRAMLARGFIYLPQDRRGEALALNRSIAENITMEVIGRSGGLGLLAYSKLSSIVSDLVRRLNISPAQPDKQVQELSGGNQQKVVLGRALSLPRKVYVFDEPTSGIDVAARRDFYDQLSALVANGAAILLISSDLQELVHLSHRVYVMQEGVCVAHLQGEAITEDAVVSHAFGAAA
ncbi:sugar ABC transporter ATP-binding protein [Ancylobacter sp. 6x-1]|uniref:Sugar ABC transporter ATP-binding protein n=1 Tax=Ancylobacter crimeensis TaxID=2579147 RepID=A0ABT0DD73_9HYPH|nr:sugar ABC transporter ATP-binding protein [Ancylobacter crimeensis]MCK0197921.1 sugar ABC transporter ATP-binding protein [Ancylobacter crimeensis]